MPGGVRKLLREPLVHFLIVGALIFAVHRLVAPVQRPDPRAARSADSLDRRLVVDASVRTAIAEQWTQSHGREPTPVELEEQVARWIDDELLYREGVARGLDRDDPRVRERVAYKMAHVVRAQAVVPEPSQQELLAWFEQHRDKWATEELYDFVHVFVAGDDEAARARITDLAAKLQGGADPSGMGDTFSGGRRYRRRKLDDLAKAFGDEFVSGMERQPEGSWVVRRSRHGMHAVRVEARTPARAPDFAAVEADVRKDWEAARRGEVFEEAMRALRARWQVVRQP